MKAKEIVVGGIYSARVGGVISRVKVLNIFQRSTGGYMNKERMSTRYTCINLRTNRRIEIKSALRFRSLVLSEAEKRDIISKADEKLIAGCGACHAAASVGAPPGSVGGHTCPERSAPPAEDSPCFDGPCEETE